MTPGAVFSKQYNNDVVFFQACDCNCNCEAEAIGATESHQCAIVLYDSLRHWDIGYIVAVFSLHLVDIISDE